MIIQPVILCGGSGTRLWPLSREKHPKQLLNLFGNNTLLQTTALRMTGLNANTVEVMSPTIVSNLEYRFIVESQLQEINCNVHMLLEPVSRNTAPALTAAALKCLDTGLDPIMLVMPADHIILDINAFHRAVLTGAHLAEKGDVVCFGITPTSADVGFGYIKTLPADAAQSFVLDQFVEKPNLETAQRYVDSGEYYWNSGIFQLKASTWISLLKQVNMSMFTACEQAFHHAQQDDHATLLDIKHFSSSPDDSIDYAVMECLGANSKLNVTTHVVPFNVGWSDVGSWDAVWQISEKDQQGNAVKGNGLTEFVQSNNNLVHSGSRRVVSLLGADDLVVIDTEDALFIANRHKISEMRTAVKHIKSKHPELMLNGRKVSRPWGTYDSIDSGNNFQVKRIVVKPGETLSLQMHYHRAEHWIVVRGTGRITCGDKVFLLSENQSTYIPMGEVHRLENPGKIPLEVIEVQSGEYLGEDDIVRFHDFYGRVPEQDKETT